MYPNTRLNVPSGFFSHPSNTGTTLSPELWRTWPIWGGSCAVERIESVITSAAANAQMVPGACLLTTFRFNNMVTTPGTAETGTRECPRWPCWVSGLLLLGRLGVPFRLPLFDLGFEVFVGQPDVV